MHHLTSMDRKSKWLVKRLLNNRERHVRVVASSRGAYFRNKARIVQPPFICKLSTICIAKKSEGYSLLVTFTTRVQIHFFIAMKISNGLITVYET